MEKIEVKKNEEEKKEIVKENEEDEVTSFRIKAASEKGIDYDKLITKFGCSRITEEQIKKIEKLTGKKAHKFLRRGLFFSQRDLDFILDTYEKKKAFYVYTGRGPSSEALHLGHMIPFIFTQYLQEVFDVVVCIELTNDEKYIHNPDLELGQCTKYGIENIKDIIACGFNPEKTFIFQDTDYIDHMYETALKVQKHVTLNTIKSIFGFNDSDNCGKFAFPAIQATPAFSEIYPQIFKGDKLVPCLIPQAIDQDPYFRMTRDVSPKIGLLKPACIHSKFFPALQGLKGKMSGSNQTSAIFLSDTPNQIKSKINKYAFSGGKDTKEEQEKYGANIDIDVSFQYLKFFLESDEELEKIAQDYKTGKLLTGHVKQILIKTLQEIVGKHQKMRAEITPEVLKSFMGIRPMNYIPKAFLTQ